MILDTYNTMLQFIETTDAPIAYDTETTGLDFFNDKIIGIGVSSAVSGYYLPLKVWSDGQLIDTGITDAQITHLLCTLLYKKLIMFNGSFDIRMTFNNFGVNLTPGLYCDAMLLKHTCDEEYPMGLKEIASKLWGADVNAEKIAMQESIKANGGTAKQYFKADLALISKYCIQDCLLTYKVYNYYSKQLKDQGLVDFFYNDEVMPLYTKVTIPMESTGVKLDIEALQSDLAAITSDISALEHNIQLRISPHLASFQEWFLDKEYPKRTYTGKIPAWTKKYKTQIEAWNVESGGAYMFNLQSKPHLKRLFFDALKVEPLSRTPTGLPQVDEEFLDHIAPKYAWAQQLIIYNKLNKIKSTYIERMLNESQNGRFFPSFKQHGTVSGRFSGDLQQLPRGIQYNIETDLVGRYTNRIRSYVIAGSGRKLIGADYESLEPKVFSHASNDPALIKIFKQGLDFYSEIAIRTEALEGVSSVKTDPTYLGKINKTKRQTAKAYALGIAYGMTGYKLQFEIGVTQNEAEKLVKKYLDAFPDLADFMDNCQHEARTHGYVRSEAGRVRHLPRCKELYNQYGPGLKDSLQLWKDLYDNPIRYECAKRDRKVYINELNNSINFKIQSLSASIVNRAAISISEQFKASGLKAHIVMQVHDELVVDAPESEVEQVCAIMKYGMENIYTISIPLVAEPKVGNKYSEIK